MDVICHFIRTIAANEDGGFGCTRTPWTLVACAKVTQDALIADHSSVRRRTSLLPTSHSEYALFCVDFRQPRTGHIIDDPQSYTKMRSSRLGGTPQLAYLGQRSTKSGRGRPMGRHCFRIQRSFPSRSPEGKHNGSKINGCLPSLPQEFFLP
jgi:hypothetical protein